MLQFNLPNLLLFVMSSASLRLIHSCHGQLVQLLIDANTKNVTARVKSITIKYDKGTRSGEWREIWPIDLKEKWGFNALECTDFHRPRGTTYSFSGVSGFMA